MKKKLVPILLGVLVLGGGFFGYTKFLKPAAPVETPAAAQERLKEEAHDLKKERLKAPIDGPVAQVPEPFTVNLADRSAKYFCAFAVALKFDLESPVVVPAGHGGGETVIEELPEIRDIIIGVVSGKTSTELTTVEGWKHVKSEIKADINKHDLHSVVIDVYITDRAIQEAA